MPRSFANKVLARWVLKQRSKRGKISSDKIKRLDELGFVWDPFLQAWETRFQELVAYKEEHGNCLVSIGWEKNKQLGKWIHQQRTLKKRGKLDADKNKLLDELGFIWEPDQHVWETRFQELAAYKQEHGNCLVARSYENKQLASWVNNQRHLGKKGKLEADKIKRLDELGFVWDPRKKR